MNAKHTPGPWTARHTPSRVPSVPDLWCIDWSKDQEEVAEIVHGEADARLIAAAPDLLEALEELRSAIIDLDQDEDGSVNLLENAIRKARLAIAKARGVAP